MSDDHRRATIAPSQRTRAALCALALTALVALLCPALASASAGAPATVTPLPRSQYTVDPVCAQPAPGRAACMALQLVARSERARAHRNPIGIARAAAPAPSAEPSPADGDFGLRPQDLHSAYELPSEGASAQTIALVDAYNDPTAEEDLATYSSEFGLPACTGANGCFAKVNENGEAGRLPFPTSLEELESARKGRGRAEAEEASSWAVEMSLDIEVAHAVCSSCHIVLVEANAADYGDLEAAEDTAASRADEISDSWAGAECAAVGVCAGASAAFDHPGKVIAAAAGDEGYLNWLEASGPSFANYPASSPDVVAVGGTRLTPLGEGGEWQGESVWNDGGEKRKGLKQGAGAGGGGCSVQFEAQPWQRALPDWSEVGCEGRRAVADVSADADPYSGVAVYDSGASCEYLEGKSVRDGHWCTLGGTSLATPLIAATFALAGGAQGVEYPAKTLYENAASSATALHDITSGSNGECTLPFDELTGTSGCTAAEEAQRSCAATLICLAGAGYDGPSGLGSPDGLAAFTPPPPAAPSAVTGSATAVTQSSASVSGEVNPNGAQVTDCEFEYGTSTAYGSRAPCAAAPGSGRSEVAVSASLPALSAGVTYHFRVVATNAIATSYGADATFTTASSGASETTGSSPQPATPQPPAPQLTQPAPEPAGAGDQPAAAAQNAEQVVAASKEQKAVTVPVAKLLASTLSVGRSGTLLARVRCVAAQTRCIGTLTLRASDADKRAGGPRGAGAVLASAAFSIAGGHVSAVRLRLSATARALLAGAHRLRLQATIRARDPAGADYSARVTVIVRDA